MQWHAVYLEGVNTKGIDLQYYTGADGEAEAISIGDAQAKIAHFIFAYADNEMEKMLRQTLDLFAVCFRPGAVKVVKHRVSKRANECKWTENSAGFIWEMTLAFALFAAARRNRTGIVRMLVTEYGADVHRKLYGGHPTLYYAIDADQAQTINLLVSELKVAITPESFNAAVEGGSLEMCTFLLESGARPNRVVGGKRYPLFLPGEAKKRYPLILTGEAKKRYPLFLASKAKNDAMESLLISFGAYTKPIEDSTEEEQDVQQRARRALIRHREQYQETNRWPQLALLVDQNNPTKVMFTADSPAIPPEVRQLIRKYKAMRAEDWWVERRERERAMRAQDWFVKRRGTDLTFSDYEFIVGPLGISEEFPIWLPVDENAIPEHQGEGRKVTDKQREEYDVGISANQLDLSHVIFAAAATDNVPLLREVIRLFRTSFRRSALIALRRVNIYDESGAITLHTPASIVWKTMTKLALSIAAHKNSTGAAELLITEYDMDVNAQIGYESFLEGALRAESFDVARLLVASGAEHVMFQTPLGGLADYEYYSSEKVRPHIVAGLKDRANKIAAAIDASVPKEVIPELQRLFVDSIVDTAFEDWIIGLE
jgi:hypothetical protein